MEKQDWFARQFEENRGRLRLVAVRMLGSASEADDAVQETWFRLSRSDAEAIDNLTGWLTTVVARVCLDMLRSRKARREESLAIEGPSQFADSSAPDPEREAILADSIGPALLVLLETLTPPERVAFVLHDMFGMPFEEIAPIVGRTEVAARKLASRARHRLRGPATNGSARERSANLRSDSRKRGSRPSVRAEALARGGRRREERRIVDAFLAAARGGDFEALLGLLDPECVVRSDDFAALLGSPRRIEGAGKVADFFNGAASDAVRATVGGIAGAAWAPHGKVRVAFSFAFRGEKILEIEFVADQKRLEELGIKVLDT